MSPKMGKKVPKKGSTYQKMHKMRILNEILINFN